MVTLGAESLSAGLEPKGLNPLAVEAMEEIGIDISTQKSKEFATFSVNNIPYVITLCDNAREMPVFSPAPTGFSTGASMIQRMLRAHMTKNS